MSRACILTVIAFFFVVNSQDIVAQCRCTASNSHFNFGSICEVYGTVVEIKNFPKKEGRPIYVMFDKPFPAHTFTLVIWGEKHPDMLKTVQGYLNKKVVIRGKIDSYRGRPQIIYKNGVRIKSLEGL